MSTSSPITLKEYISNQENLEKQAKIEFPGELDLCTYPNDSRQLIFSCKDCSNTCCCYVCYVMCHSTCNVLELFYKRDMICECGIVGNNCAKSVKSTDFIKNIKNHNFDGKYCFCDAEYSGDQVMYQCLICEDWFHDKCLDFIPQPDTFDEIVCKTCVEKFDFLACYQHHLEFNFGKVAKRKLSGVKDPNCKLFGIF